MKQFVPVLRYRNISPVSGVTPTEFALHLTHLAEEGWHSITVDELLGFLKEEGALPEKPYLITFDDVFLDNWMHALPILRRYGVHAAFGCATAFLHDMPIRPISGETTADLHGFPSARDAWDLALEKNDFSAFMSRSEILALDEAGFEILGHTHTHQLCFTSNIPTDRMDMEALSDVHGIYLESADVPPMYPTGSAYAHDGFFPSDSSPFSSTLIARSTAERIEFCAQEFALCRERLEAFLPRPARAMIWVRGEYDDVAIQAASLAGYEAAFTLGGGANGADAKRFALRRISVDGGTPARELLSRMARATNPYLPAFIRNR